MKVNLKKYLLPPLFFLTLAFPLVNHYTGLVYDIKSFENRAPAPLPKFNVSKLDPFPSRYEKYYDDHFTLRNQLIRNYSVFKLRVFKQSPFPEAIVVGHNNWLYQAADELDVYTGKAHLDARQMELLKKELSYRKEYLEKRGCRFCLMVVPCKANVHTENMRAQYYRLNSVSLGEQFINYLDSSNSGIDHINLFTLFREKKKEQAVYYKMDTHWNKIGALHAANAFFEKLMASFKSVKPLKLRQVNTVKIKSPDLLKMIGNVSFLQEFENEPVLENAARSFEAPNAGYKAPDGFVYSYLFENTRQTRDSLLPRLLVVSDSFGENLFGYLSENFSRSVKLWDAWQYKLNEDVVEGEKPEVFLLVVHEKNLKLILKYCSAPGIRAATE